MGTVRPCVTCGNTFLSDGDSGEIDYCRSCESPGVVAIAALICFEGAANDAVMRQPEPDEKA